MLMQHEILCSSGSPLAASPQYCAMIVMHSDIQNRRGHSTCSKHSARRAMTDFTLLTTCCVLQETAWATPLVPRPGRHRNSPTTASVFVDAKDAHFVHAGKLCYDQHQQHDEIEAQRLPPAQQSFGVTFCSAPCSLEMPGFISKCRPSEAS